MKISDHIIKSPFIKYVALQIFFWSVYNFFLANMVFLNFSVIVETYNIPMEMHYSSLVFYALGMALFHGMLLGFAGYRANKLFFVSRSIQQALIVQSLISISIFILTFIIVRIVIEETLSLSSTFDNTIWSYIFNLAFVHYSVGSILIAFANQVVRKFGKSIVVPMLFGAYRKPRPTDKIFMFLDLKSSTRLTEKFGHDRYSSFIQEFIIDINHCLDPFGAEVYQYVGDEAVIIWNSSSHNAQKALNFFFALYQQIEKRRQFYCNKFDAVPTFKAGIDCGTVTAVEIGDIKRDIAYHGDAINSAARIQNLCNKFDRLLIVSQNFLELFPPNSEFKFDEIVKIKLRGKEMPTKLFGVVSETYSLKFLTRIVDTNYKSI